LHLQKTYEEVRTDQRVKSEEEEAFKILPQATATALRKLQRKQRTINLSIVFLLVVSTLILAALSSDYIQPINAVFINWRAQIPSATFSGDNVAWEKSTSS
jgi:dCTP deaminase